MLTKCDVNVEGDDSIKFNVHEKQRLQDIHNELQKLSMKLLRIKSDLKSSLGGSYEERAELEDEERVTKSVRRWNFLILGLTLHRINIRTLSDK